MNRNTHWTEMIAASAFALASLAATGAFAAEGADDQRSAEPAQSANAPLAGGASNPPTFEAADANNNGLIEPDEVYRVGVPFPMLDRNGDGTVSRVEYMNSTAQYATPDSELNPNQQADRD